jgi:16S rRNA G966 N2-methylase RsmD
MWPKLLKRPKSTATDTAGVGGFFDDYPDFYETSQTTPFRNRLNRRYDAIIAANQAQIHGQRLLDIASHDGRWSFAALKSGAAHVLGIEGRPELVENANANMRRYGIEPHRYRFVVGDIHEHIAKLEPNSIDTVLCLGFFYHTPHHCYLLSQIKRLNPHWLILDTVVTLKKQRVIAISTENSESERNAIATVPNRRKALVGWPSRPAVEFMLDAMGFAFTSFDWPHANIASWQHIEDYHNGKRITLTAENLDYIHTTSAPERQFYQ